MLSGTIGLRTGFPLSFLSQPYHLHFLFRMLGALLVLGTEPPFLHLLLGLGLAGIAALAVLSNAVDADILAERRGVLLPLMGIASVLVVVGEVVAERRGAIRLPAWVGTLGDAACCRYLLHLPVVILGGELAAGVAPESQPEVLTMLLYLVSMVLALVFYRVVERPMLRASARGGVSSTPPPAAGEPSRP